MNSQLGWDDLRLVLAVVEAGSLSAAGRRLGSSHATVFRRLGGIERRLGVRLFDRARAGYSPTTAGEEVAAAARRIEIEVLDLERRVVGRDLRPSGRVRVTTTDSLLFGLLSPSLAGFCETHRAIDLEVAVSNQQFSLSRREAEVAIRPSSSPPESLVGRRIGTIAQAVYLCRDLAAGASDGPAFDALGWVGADEVMAYRALDLWMAEQGLADRCHYRVDSVLGMFLAARDGAGPAVLPCYLADGEPRLVRVGEPVAALATDLWLLTHPDLRKVARIRAVLDFLAAEVKARRGHLSGSG